LFLSRSLNVFKMIDHFPKILRKLSLDAKPYYTHQLGSNGNLIIALGHIKLLLAMAADIYH
jgi:hypothetical protein